MNLARPSSLGTVMYRVVSPDGSLTDCPAGSGMSNNSNPSDAAHHLRWWTKGTISIFSQMASRKAVIMESRRVLGMRGILGYGQGGQLSYIRKIVTRSEHHKM